MGRFCCIPGCISRKNKQKVSYFSIPSPKNNQGVEVRLKRRRHDAWLKAIGRTDLTGTKLQHASVCSVHFIRGAPSAEDYDTHPDWVPSMFLKSHEVNKEKYNKNLKKMEEFKREKDKQRRNLLQSFAGDSILMRLLLSTVKAKGYKYEAPLIKKNNVELKEFDEVELTVDSVEQFEIVVEKEENVEPKIEEFGDIVIKEEIIKTKVKEEDINIGPSNEEDISEAILGI